MLKDSGTLDAQYLSLLSLILVSLCSCLEGGYSSCLFESYLLD